MKGRKRLFIILAITGVVFFSLLPLKAAAQPRITVPGINIEIGPAEEPQELVGTLQLMLLLTVLTLAPAIIILMTSFTRLVVVLSFVRNALATQQTPPNQVIIGLALFLTVFIMAPVYREINSNAIQPYVAGELTQEEALAAGEKPLREFMLKQTREKDLALFINISGSERRRPGRCVFDRPDSRLCVSELKTAFQMGFRYTYRLSSLIW